MSRVTTQPARSNPAPLATLPQGFAALATAAPAAKASDGDRDAFLWFATPKSKLWSDMQAKFGPGLLENDPVFVSPGHTEIIRVVKYHLVTAQQYWARKDGATGQPAGGVVYEKAPGLEEYIDAVLMVQTSKGLLPCRCRFKSGLIGGVTPALKELEAVRDDQDAWTSRSAAHAAAMKVTLPAPCFRFLVTATFAPKTGKASGRPYLAGKATCAPVTPQDAELVLRAIGNPDVAKLCELVAQEHGQRLDGVRKLPA